MRRQLDAQLDRTGAVFDVQHGLSHARGNADAVPVGGRVLAGALARVAHLPRDLLAVARGACRHGRDPSVPGALPHDAGARAFAARPGQHAKAAAIAAPAAVRDVAAKHLRASQRRFFQREPDAASDRSAPRPGVGCGWRSRHVVCRRRAGHEPRQPNLFIGGVDPLPAAQGIRRLVAVRVPLRNQPPPSRFHNHDRQTRPGRARANGSGRRFMEAARRSRLQQAGTVCARQ